MKKSFIVFCSIVLILTKGFAFEWGGVFDNESTIGYDIFPNKNYIAEFSFTQKNGLHVWLSNTLSKDGIWKLNSEVAYIADINSQPEPVFQNILDLTLLKVSGQVPMKKSTIDISLGRFFISDKTENIFSTTSDGAYLKFNLSRVGIGGYIGFTGLLNSLNVNGIFGFNDESVAHIYKLQYPVVPIILSFDFPSLFANQNLSFQVLGSIDCGNDVGNKFYGTLLLDGPIYSKLFYTVQTTFGTQNFTNIMNYTSLNFMWFPLSFANINLGVQYASGNEELKELNVVSYSSVTSTSKESIKGLPVSDCLLPAASIVFYSGPFYSKFEVKCDLDILNEQGQLFSVRGYYGKLNSTFNVFSDLQIGLDLNLYINATENQNVLFNAVIKAAFAF